MANLNDRGVATGATLTDAAMNPDGSYNGAHAMSWLSEALHPGHGLPVDEVVQIAAEAKGRLATRQAGSR